MLSEHHSYHGQLLSRDKLPSDFVSNMRKSQVRFNASVGGPWDFKAGLQEEEQNDPFPQTWLRLSNNDDCEESSQGWSAMREEYSGVVHCIDWLE